MWILFLISSLGFFSPSIVYCQTGAGGSNVQWKANMGDSSGGIPINTKSNSKFDWSSLDIADLDKKGMQVGKLNQDSLFDINKQIESRYRETVTKSSKNSKTLAPHWPPPLLETRWPTLAPIWGYQKSTTPPPITDVHSNPGTSHSEISGKKIKTWMENMYKIVNIADNNFNSISTSDKNTNLAFNIGKLGKENTVDSGINIPSSESDTGNTIVPLTKSSSDTFENIVTSTQITNQTINNIVTSKTSITGGAQSTSKPISISDIPAGTTGPLTEIVTDSAVVDSGTGLTSFQTTDSGVVTVNATVELVQDPDITTPSGGVPTDISDNTLLDKSRASVLFFSTDDGGLSPDRAASQSTIDNTISDLPPPPYISMSRTTMKYVDKPPDIYDRSSTIKSIEGIPIPMDGLNFGFKDSILTTNRIDYVTTTTDVQTVQTTDKPQTVKQTTYVLTSTNTSEPTSEVSGIQTTVSDQSLQQTTDQSARQTTSERSKQSTDQQETSDSSKQTTYQSVQQGTSVSLQQTTDKSVQQGTSVSSQQTTNPSAQQTTDKSVQQGTSVSSQQTTNPSAQQTTDQSVQQGTSVSSKQTTNPSVQQTTDQSAQQTIDQSFKQTTNPSPQQTTDQSVQQGTSVNSQLTTNPSAQQTTDQSVQQGTSVSSQQTINPSAQQTTDQNAQQTIDQSSQQTTNPSILQTTGQSAQQTTSESSQQSTDQNIQKTTVSPDKTSSFVPDRGTIKMTAAGTSTFPTTVDQTEINNDVVTSFYTSGPSIGTLPSIEIGPYRPDELQTNLPDIIVGSNVRTDPVKTTQNIASLTQTTEDSNIKTGTGSSLVQGATSLDNTNTKDPTSFVTVSGSGLTPDVTSTNLPDAAVTNKSDVYLTDAPDVILTNTSGVKPTNIPEFTNNFNLESTKPSTSNVFDDLIEASIIMAEWKKPGVSQSREYNKTGLENKFKDLDIKTLYEIATKDMKLMKNDTENPTTKAPSNFFVNGSFVRKWIHVGDGVTMASEETGAVGNEAAMGISTSQSSDKQITRKPRAATKQAALMEKLIEMLTELQLYFSRSQPKSKLPFRLHDASGHTKLKEKKKLESSTNSKVVNETASNTTGSPITTEQSVQNISTSTASSTVTTQDITTSITKGITSIVTGGSQSQNNKETNGNASSKTSETEIRQKISHDLATIGQLPQQTTTAVGANEQQTTESQISTPTSSTQMKVDTTIVTLPSTRRASTVKLATTPLPPVRIVGGLSSIIPADINNIDMSTSGSFDTETEYALGPIYTQPIETTTTGYLFNTAESKLSHQTVESTVFNLSPTDGTSSFPSMSTESFYIPPNSGMIRPVDLFKSTRSTQIIFNTNKGPPPSWLFDNPSTSTTPPDFSAFVDNRPGIE